jgi:hypothetical protein
MNTEPAIIIAVHRQSGADVIATVDAIKKALAKPHCRHRSNSISCRTACRRSAPASPTHACADDRIAPVSPTVDLGDYFANWFTRVDEAQATQPHWKAPLITTTPLLTELVRYDQY